MQYMMCGQARDKGWEHSELYSTQSRYPPNRTGDDAVGGSSFHRCISSLRTLMSYWRRAANTAGTYAAPAQRTRKYDRALPSAGLTY